VPPFHADVDRRRRRLMRAAFTLLVGFSGLSVALSFAGSDVLGSVTGYPVGARLGVFALTIAFTALVWERDRGLRRMAERLTTERMLTTALESRLRALEALIAAGDRLDVPLGMDDALRVVLDGAIDISGAAGGAVQAVAENADVALVQSHRRSGRDHEDVLRVPLEAGGVRYGVLELAPPEASGDFEPAALDALQRFTSRAASALHDSGVRDHERASIAYLRAASLVKSSFLSTVSHELRTPLTSVVGYSSTLSRHWTRLSTDQREEFLGIVQEQGLRLGRLVERLLEAARLEVDASLIEPVRHDVRKSVLNGLSAFPHTERLRVELPPSPVIADIDPMVIDQAVSNLVDNALRHTTGPVEVSLKTLGATIELAVVDGGADEARGEVDGVPKPGREVDHTGVAGPGFGLHIVRRVVDQHDGTFEFESEPSGTTAVVKLPARPRPVAEDPAFALHDA
jgi:signal transduction histidine kinase